MATMVKLQTVTVGSGGASSIEFTNIPQTYTDLKLVMSLRTNYASGFDNAKISFNGSTAGFTYRRLFGSGSTASSDSGSNNTNSIISNAATSTSSVFANGELYIPNYTSANNKSYSIDAVSENNATQAFNYLAAGLWSNTAAITSLTLTPQDGTLFAQYTTATLYGVKNVTTATGTGKAIGGDEIYTDGTYWYHKFTTVGTTSFTPLTSLTVDYLVVAGGGSGAVSNNGNNGTGGGGAGGVRCTVGATGGGGSLESPLSLTAQAYTVTVGDGGASRTGTGNVGANGSNSVFATITAIGGGGGGYWNGTTHTVGTGGSGGGAGVAQNGTSKTGGAGTANQGFAGGNSGTGASSGMGSGGGGGAGAVGSNGTSTAGGAGGTGITTNISGISATYGGGGGGADGNAQTSHGAGGAGGGTAGGDPSTSAATANTGGGSGGANATSGSGTSGKGGSGIVIIRYPV